MNETTAPKLLVRAPVTVRWGDMDAYTHVNNSVYATYVEEARLQWFRSLDAGWMGEDAAPTGTDGQSVASLADELRKQRAPAVDTVSEPGRRLASHAIPLAN